MSRLDPLPHQLEAVYDYLLKLARVRFLLADDAGAGKTIMAGLLIRELELRGLAERVLIACPANLAFQWQRELKEKSDEMFLVYRGPDIREIFSRYRRVETAEGREVKFSEYLEKVWEVAGRTAPEQVLGTAEARARNGAAEAVEEDARLTALFLWTLQSTNGASADSISMKKTSRRKTRTKSPHRAASKKASDTRGRHWSCLPV
ncbi:MAG: DEAD/DEAH box helicase family protein [Bryobacteraceae bacterium]|nr:DEAD/DEAH box helicase family protein [Bryobacteraceae bacterium]